MLARQCQDERFPAIEISLSQNYVACLLCVPAWVSVVRPRCCLGDSLGLAAGWAEMLTSLHDTLVFSVRGDNFYNLQGAMRKEKSV